MQEKVVGQLPYMPYHVLRPCLLQTVAIVNVGSNQLGDEGAALFSATLGSNNHLNKHLELSDNSINCEEIAHLASSLMVNISLQNLIRYSNPIRAEGSDTVFGMLAMNQTLQRLDLDNCEIECTKDLATIHRIFQS